MKGLLASLHARLLPAPSSEDARLELLRARSKAFSKQVPLLYSILGADAATVSYSFTDKAPWVLAQFIPGLLLVICTVRMFVWLRRSGETITLQSAQRQFQSTTLIAAMLGLLFIGWTFGLYEYGDVAMRGQVAATFAITAICNIYCLLHYPEIALTLAACTVPIFCGFLFLTGSSTAIAFGVDLLIVTLGMCYMVVRSARDFTRLIDAQVETGKLSDTNFRLANVDMLTGLPNRRQFFDRLDRAYAESEADGRRFFIASLDLDGFKQVNDKFGHAMGDRVLTECGERLLDSSWDFAARGVDTFVARLGGDEFGLIIEGAMDETRLEELGCKICGALRRPFEFEGVIASIGCSIGFAAYPDSGESPEQIYERADYALYYAKHARRGDAVLFSLEHEDRMKGFANIDQCLRRADFDAEFSLEFQPICRIEDREILAYEALARWNSPELGVVPPGLFISVAERSDVICRLTRSLLRKALAAAAQWPEDVRLSFNLSCRDLSSPTAISQIVSIIETGGVRPDRIDLEVTETALLPDFERARESIAMLKRTGARISLDDFGTGYSSLNYVHRLPFDKIKIDRSFVEGMETSGSAKDIVKTIFSMCRNLRLTCVVEGVESEEQLALVSSIGGELAQGYLFGKPMSQAEISAQNAHDAEARAHELA